MGQDLLGYVLGGLDAAEHEAVEQKLANDPELRGKLATLRERLELFRDDDYEPPAGLAARTCDFVERHRATTAAASRLGVDAPSGRSSWRLIDWVVAVSVVAAAILVAIPLVYTQRNEARLLACENNLREFGVAMLSYAKHHRDHFPGPPAAGNRAAAGIVVPILIDGGYLQDQRLVICPSSELAAQRDWSVPSLAEIDGAGADILHSLQERMGGSNSYHIGYIVNGEHQTPIDLRRPQYALVTCTPESRLRGQQSSHHRCGGQNVLFEDMHTEFVVGCTAGECQDDIFCNRNGEVAVGLDVNDAVLAPSPTRPFQVQPVKLQSK